jgi:hypothetical protein
MASSDTLSRLQGAGVELDKLSDAQREVLTSLSPNEVDTMISIKQKLEATGEVEGFAKGTNNVGASFF